MTSSDALTIIQTPSQTTLLLPDLLAQVNEHWQRATELFIASRKSENTRRAYRRHIAEFLAWAEKMPWAIASADTLAYANHCRTLGQTNETVNAKIAAISSYYQFLLTDYELPLPQRTLVNHNPATARSLRTRINPYGKSYWMDPSACGKLLRAIPQNTPQGLRDHALFFTFLATGRRNTEVRHLRYGDFEEKGGRVFYRWTGKNKKDQLNELPLFVWNLIQTYLKQSGRLATIKETSYVFVAHTPNAQRLPSVQNRTDALGNHRPYNPAEEPLSLAQVGALLKKYARLAGLKANKIHVHTLRHSAAMLRKAAGDDLEQISAHLGHASLATTQVYMHALEGKKDTSWSAVQALLGY